MKDFEMRDCATTLEGLFVEIIDRIAEDEDLFRTRSREDIFSPALTMWAMVCQRTKGRMSLVKTLESIMAGDADLVIQRNVNGKRAGKKNYSSNSGAISRAQQRLPQPLVEKVSRAVCDAVISESTGHEQWRGKRVVLVDGTVIALSHSPKNHHAYPPNRNQHGRSHTPLMLCMCCHELFSGAAIYPQFGPYRGNKATSEQRLLFAALADIPSGTLILGDRNMGVCSVAARAQQQGHEVLLRLTEIRGRSFAAGEKGEFVDKKAIWKMTKGTLKKHPEFAPDTEVRGRFIKWTVKNNGSRPLELLFFTTSDAPAQELVELYKARERIENDIRSLKHTLGLEILHAKSPDMIAKELLLAVAAYNLTRAIIIRAARELGIPTRQVSFSRATGLIHIYGNRMRDASSQKELSEIWQHLRTALYQSRLPTRTLQRSEPRKLAYSRQRFPVMTRSRSQERKAVEKTLKQFGHRGYFTSVTRKY